MKPANDHLVGVWAPLPPSLDAVIGRLEGLSLAPQFVRQRDVALGRALPVYLSPSAGSLLTPLAQEVHLAELFLYADFYPEDGQLTLIEQLRDVITKHIPQEERQWLDPLKHSYMDVVELLPPSAREPALVLRSIGDGRRYHVRLKPSTLQAAVGQVLLTRLIRKPGDQDSEATIAGSALVLSAEDAKAFYESVSEDRRELELARGSFELGDWAEFAKRYGHLLLSHFARMRMAALVEAITQIRYASEDGMPYLYAIAVYEHHLFAHLAETLGEIQGFRLQEPRAATVPEEGENHAARTWIMTASPGARDAVVVARLTLTASQLWVECDSRERLDSVKHAVAAAYGFSLHFRGETITPPRKDVSADQLAADEPLVITITAEEDRALLRSFLVTTYLEWADQESPALGGQTPRHAATSAEGRKTVEALIAGMGRHDLGLVRTGVRAFDYNKLRAHVGLEERSGD